MKALNLAIYTGSDNTNKVTMNAEFASHDEAVRFHEGVSKLCQQHSLGTQKPQWPLKLLGRQE